MAADSLEARLRELLAGLQRDAEEARAAYTNDPKLHDIAEAMSAGIEWAVDALEKDLLGAAGEGPAE